MVIYIKMCIAHAEIFFYFTPGSIFEALENKPVYRSNRPVYRYNRPVYRYNRPVYRFGLPLPHHRYTGQTGR